MRSFYISLGIQISYLIFVFKTNPFYGLSELAAIIAGIVYAISLIPYLISFLIIKRKEINPEKKELYNSNGWTSFMIFALINVLMIGFEMIYFIDQIGDYFHH